MIFFHKYALLKTNFKDEKEAEIAAVACFFVATKVCNVLVSLSKLIPAYFTLKGKANTDQSSKEEFKNSVIEAEFEILSQIGFDLNIDLPYIYIEKMKPYLNQHLKDLEKKVIFNFLNDSFKLPMILYYSPIKIALTAIYLLKFHFKVDLPDTKDGEKWYHYLDSTIELEELSEIASLWNKMYYLIKQRKLKAQAERKIGEVIISCSLKEKNDKIEESLLGNKRIISSCDKFE